MAEEASTIDLNDSSHDFANMAIKTITEDPDKAPPVKETTQQVQKQPEAKKDEPKSRIPDSLFDPVKKDPDPKKDEPAKAAESEIDKIQRPDFKSPKAAEQWDSLRAKASEYEKKAADLEKKMAEREAKLAELDGKSKQAAELEAKYAEMEKKHRESMELVQKVNIELDPDFRRTFVDGRNKLIDHAKTIVEESGGNPRDIETALNLTGKSRVDALAEIAESMNSFQQGRLGRVIDSLTDLDKTAAEKRSNPEQYLSQRQQEEQQRAITAKEERAKHMNISYEEALSKAASEIEVLRRVEGMPEWNEQAENIMRKAKENWNGQLDMTSAASKFIAAEAMPVFRQLFLEQRKEASDWKQKYEQASEELAAINSNRPGMRTRSAAASSGKEMDFASRTIGTMNGSIPVSGQ